MIIFHSAKQPPRLFHFPKLDLAEKDELLLSVLVYKRRRNGAQIGSRCSRSTKASLYGLALWKLGFLA